MLVKGAPDVYVQYIQLNMHTDFVTLLCFYYHSKLSHLFTDILHGCNPVIGAIDRAPVPLKSSLWIWIRSSVAHDDVIKWEHFPRYWPFMWGIHRSPMNSPHKGQWRGTLMYLSILPKSFRVTSLALTHARPWSLCLNFNHSYQICDLDLAKFFRVSSRPPKRVPKMIDEKQSLCPDELVSISMYNCLKVL